MCVSIKSHTKSPHTEHARFIKGITYEPAEDNLFNWKCSIKGSVRLFAYARQMGFEIRAVGQPIQGGHVLLQTRASRRLSVQSTNGTAYIPRLYHTSSLYYPSQVTFTTKIYHP